MKKWEYVEVTAPVREDGQSVHIYLNGTEAVRESKLSALADYLNKLGEEGWELVNFAFHPNSTRFYYFKRPIK